MSERILFYGPDDGPVVKAMWLSFWVCVAVFYILLFALILSGNGL